MKNTFTKLALAGLMASTMIGGASAQEDTIKVGILHSLSGTMAISETTLKDAMLMLIEEQNKKGGLLGKKLEAVVVDPASDWPLFAEKARELIEVNDVQLRTSEHRSMYSYVRLSIDRCTARTSEHHEYSYVRA